MSDLGPQTMTATRLSPSAKALRLAAATTRAMSGLPTFTQSPYASLSCCT